MEDKLQKKTKPRYLLKGFSILLFIAFFLAGFIVGENWNRAQELNWCAEVAVKFAKQQNITINKELVTIGALMYKNHINEWLNINITGS